MLKNGIKVGGWVMDNQVRFYKLVYLQLQRTMRRASTLPFIVSPVSHAVFCLAYLASLGTLISGPVQAQTAAEAGSALKSSPMLIEVLRSQINPS